MLKGTFYFLTLAGGYPAVLPPETVPSAPANALGRPGEGTAMTAPQIVKGQDLWGPCAALSHPLRGASREGGSGRGEGHKWALSSSLVSAE